VPLELLLVEEVAALVGVREQKRVAAVVVVPVHLGEEEALQMERPSTTVFDYLVVEVASCLWEVEVLSWMPMKRDEVYDCSLYSADLLLMGGRKVS
jgi:hypothetical protein